MITRRRIRDAEAHGQAFEEGRPAAEPSLSAKYCPPRKMISDSPTAITGPTTCMNSSRERELSWVSIMESNRCQNSTP